MNHYFISTLEELNYDCAIIHVGINDILRSRDMSELKVGRTCQSYSVGKVHVSPILPSTWTFIDIGQINKVIKELS